MRTPPFEKSVLQDAGPRLPDHFLDSRPGHGEVVLRAAVPLGEGAVRILQVREPHLDLPLQGPQGLHTLIPPGVPDHGDGEGGLQGLPDSAGEGSGADEVDVVGPLGGELPENLPQALHGDGFPDAAPADGGVLAVDAPEHAPGKEHGPAPAGAADAGLLPVVEGGPGDDRQAGLAAEAVPGLLRAHRAASAGTEIADHMEYLLVFSAIIPGGRRFFQGGGKILSAKNEGGPRRTAPFHRRRFQTSHTAAAARAAPVNQHHRGTLCQRGGRTSCLAA